MVGISERLQHFYGITSAEAAIFLEPFRFDTLPKGATFLKRDAVCNKVGLIEQGLMCCKLHGDGADTVFEFAYDGSFISDYYSYVKGIPSQKTITCLEDTTMYVATRADLERLGAQYPFVQQMSARTNEYLFLQLHSRLTSLLQDSAALRYQKLIAERQDLASRIPQYLLASYLNVQPETLSRIRRKMADGLLS